MVNLMVRAGWDQRIPRRRESGDPTNRHRPQIDADVEALVRYMLFAR